MSKAPASIFFDGTVIQMNQRGSIANAFAIEDGKFLAVGSNDDIRGLKVAGTKEFNLEGHTVIPGFNDSHNHMLETGLELGKIQLGGARKLGDILDAIGSKAEASREREWVVCSAAWHESQLAEGVLPNRWQLDGVSPRNPVYLPRGGHTLVVNGLALKIAGIDRNTPDPPGGKITKDPKSGEPTGLLFEPKAIGLVQRHIDRPSAAQKEQAVKSAMAAFNAVGITSVIEPGLAPDELEMYRKLRWNEQLSLRTSCMIGLGWLNWPDATTENVRQLRRYIRSEDPLFQVDGIKLFADGGIESALLEMPHCIVPGEQEDSSFSGVQLMGEDQLAEVVAAANENDWRVGVHAVGDAAIGLVLKAYSKAHATKPLNDKRYILIHGILPKPEHFAIMQQLGVVVTTQVHNNALGDNMIRYWGRDRASRANPVKQYLQHHIPVAGGTDSPVCPYDQLLAVWSQVTRLSKQGHSLGRDLALTQQQALRLHTSAGSYITFEEGRKGSIDPGKWADFVVLSRSPLECPLGEIKEIQVLETVVGGVTVWRSER